jgi:hypothetical protein
MTVVGALTGDARLLLRNATRFTTEALPSFDGVNTVNLDWYGVGERGHVATQGSATPVVRRNVK